MDSIINDLGFTKENLTNELKEIYNKYKQMEYDNKKLSQLNNEYNILLLEKNKKMMELENIITNYEIQIKTCKQKNNDYKTYISKLENDSSKEMEFQNMKLLISKEKELNIELNNKLYLSKKNESIFKDHNNYLLKVNSKLLKNNIVNSISTKNIINDKYHQLLDNKTNIKTEFIHLINNIEYHIKTIIGNQEFNVWIPDHYEKKLCESTIIYVLSILST